MADNMTDVALATGDATTYDNGNISVDQEAVAAAKTALQRIGSDVYADFQTIVSALQSVDASGDIKSTIEDSVTKITASIGSLTLPDALGESLGRIAEKLGLQQEATTKIFSNWSAGLAAVAEGLTSGVKGVISEFKTAPTDEDATTYTLSNYIGDTTKKIAETGVSIAHDTNKLVYSITGGKTIADVARNIGTKITDFAKGAFGKITTAISSNGTSSNLGGVLSKITSGFKSIFAK